MANALSQFKKLEDKAIQAGRHTIVSQYWAGPTKNGEWVQISHHSIDGSEIDEGHPEVLRFLAEAEPRDQHLFRLG